MVGGGGDSTGVVRWRYGGTGAAGRGFAGEADAGASADRRISRVGANALSTLGKEGIGDFAANFSGTIPKGGVERENWRRETGDVVGAGVRMRSGVAKTVLGIDDAGFGIGIQAAL